MPIPAVGFYDAAPSLKKIFNDQLNIYVTPDQYFTTKFREMFQKTKLTHLSGKESKTWLAGPNIKYWPQQLNLLSGARQRAVVSVVKFSMTTLLSLCHRMCELFTSSIYILLSGEYCFRWEEYKA